MKEAKLSTSTGEGRQFILPDSAKFVCGLLKVSQETALPEKGRVQMVFLNNDEYEVPYSSTLAATTCPSDLEGQPALHRSEYAIKVEERSGAGHTRTETARMTLAEAAGAFSKGLRDPVRPFVAAEYTRRLFIPNDMHEVNVAVDTNLRYFQITRQGIFLELRIDKEDRVEIQSNKNGEVSKALEGLLADSGAIPTVPKESTAYNLFGSFIKTTYGGKIYKELPGIEIESKLEFEGQDPLPKIKELFKKGEVQGFVLPSNFPFTVVGGKINRYYHDDTGVFKAMFAGPAMKIVRKGESLVAQDPYDLNCILRRKEEKSERIPITPEILANATMLGELSRERRAFWVDNAKNGRIYHLSTDRCINDSGEFCELEIEFVGSKRSGGNASEVEIVGDIAFLTKFMIDRFPNLRPSTLTKEEWLAQKRTTSIV